MAGDRYVTGAGYYWILEPEEVFGQLAGRYWLAIHQAVKELADRYAPEIENWMKANAPWQDRTTNARQTLHVEVEEVIGQMVTIILSHGMHYGLFLEVSNGGKYAIVNPALDYFGPKIWSDVKALVTE